MLIFRKNLFRTLHHILPACGICFFTLSASVYAQSDGIRIIEDQGQGVITLYGENSFDTDCEVLIDIESFGLDYSRPEPFTSKIPAGQTMKLIVLTPQPGKAWKYSFNVKYKQIVAEAIPKEPRVPETQPEPEPAQKSPVEKSWPYTEYGPPDTTPQQIEDTPLEPEDPVRHQETTTPDVPIQPEKEQPRDHKSEAPGPAPQDDGYVPYSDYGPPVYPDEKPVNAEQDPPSEMTEPIEEMPAENKTEESMPDTAPRTESRGDKSYRPSTSVNVTPASTPAREKAELKGIMLYTEPSCQRCALARDLLDKLGVKYAEVDLRTPSNATTGLWEQLKTFGFSGGPVNTPVVAYGSMLYHDIDDVRGFLINLIGN